jgi:murein DD-endopeptidase MepM/ murein hydrolase activator NlpD
MRNVLILGVLLVAGCAAGASVWRGEGARRGRCAWNVCVTTEDDERGRTYLARNDEPVPVTVVMSFGFLDNLQRPEGGRVERVIPPDSTVRVRLDRMVPGTFAADLSISIDLGASTTEPEAYPYAVPFGGRAPRPVIQGFEGAETHIGSMRYALDIGMPPNTPVFAARDGVVLYIQDGFAEGRADPEFLERANLVVVAHRDGTMASYGHLSRGVEVEVGDTVGVGDLLGWSGRSGFAGRPHLHFHVGVRMLGEPGRTIPIELVGSDGSVLDLSEGAAIRPARLGPERRF